MRPRILLDLKLACHALITISNWVLGWEQLPFFDHFLLRMIVEHKIHLTTHHLLLMMIHDGSTFRSKESIWTVEKWLSPLLKKICSTTGRFLMMKWLVFLAKMIRPIYQVQNSLSRVVPYAEVKSFYPTKKSAFSD